MKRTERAKLARVKLEWLRDFLGEERFRVALVRYWFEPFIRPKFERALGNARAAILAPPLIKISSNFCSVGLPGESVELAVDYRRGMLEAEVARLTAELDQKAADLAFVNSEARSATGKYLAAEGRLLAARRLPRWAILHQKNLCYAVRYVDGMDTSRFAIGGQWIEAAALEALLEDGAAGAPGVKRP